MKHLIIILFLSVGTATFAQSQEPIQQVPHNEPDCIIWPADLNIVALAFEADVFYRGQLEYPTWDAVNPFANNSESRYHLDQDLPFSQILTTGSIMTFDHIRYSVRN